MKGSPVDRLVYDYMFPRPKSNDPQNFHALLQRSLIPEVRQETHSFYGHLDTQEAKYPGLDYTHRTHRIRLSRWPWHRRLFRAFDGLRLTNAEIAGLTKWEGTKWAKEKFEREQGISIRDTTADGFPDWSEIEDHHRASDTYLDAFIDEEEGENDEEMDVESDLEEIESVGVQLNERLRAQAARREAGDSTAVLDEEWEQWLKNAIETGEFPFLEEYIDHHGTDSASVVPAALFPPGMLSAARAGQWSEIPDFLHPMLRRTLEAEEPNHDDAPQQAGEVSSSSSTSPLGAYRRRYLGGHPWNRRTYSDLRLPLGNNPRTTGPELPLAHDL